jgi:serine/threonine protein kinase
MDATAAWAVGSVVDDLHEVRDVITTGGMGVVYRVHHRRLEHRSGGENTTPGTGSSPRRMADFETEAETWVGLGLHPHIVACVYVRRLGGLPRVFAEWVDGGSLDDAISTGRLYEGTNDEVTARILDIAIQFAWGLDYAHSRGLIHQDVKPANVMLSVDWTVKVTDFGLAKARAAAGETTDAAPGGSVLAGYRGANDARSYGVCKFSGGPAVVFEFVVVAAGQGEGVDVGDCGGCPAVDVVDFAPVSGDVAAGVGASAVLGVEDDSLTW